MRSWLKITLAAGAFGIAVAAQAGGEEAPEPAEAEHGLEVSTHAPDEDGLQLKWPTHIAFGPGTGEVITDLKNNRFVYRDSPDDAWQASPVAVSGPHSLVHNPADGLYYANDTANHRIIAFSDLSSGTIAAQTNSIAGVTLNRPHDILRDPATGWIYALNPNSGHVFRFTAIGQNESAVQAPTGGYTRAISLVNGEIYVIGSSKGRIVKIVDWDTPTFQTYDSHDPTGKSGPAGSWTKTGLVLNDAEYFDGCWYATSYFTQAYAGGTDFDENKFIRFETLDDLVAGNWTDLSSLVPSGMTPYFLTVNGNSLHLAIFNHESPGTGDAILRFIPAPPPKPLSITEIVHDSLAATTTLTWDSNEGEVFDAFKRVDLAAGVDFWTLIKSGIPAAAAPARVTTDLVDTNAIDSRSFYRISRFNDGE